MELLIKISGVILLVLLNGYFVASEFALVSVRKTRVDELARKGNKAAKRLQKALHDLSQYISATQLGITLASLALGWIGEPAIAHLIEPLFSFLPTTAAFITSHAVAATIAFTIITYLHIVIGELAPKSFALQHAERMSLLFITPLIIFAKVFRPFIWLLNISGQFVLRIFRVSPVEKQTSIYSEEEVKMILNQSSVGGTIPRREVEMVLNAFRLGDIPVKVVMIPRTDILAFPVATTLKLIAEKIESHPHSRFPIYENSIDNIIGFVHIKDVYRELLRRGEKARVSQLQIVRQILTVPEGKKIDAVLQDMRLKRIHIAIVNDEFGGTAGLVTLEDVIESLVGEIEDEFDQPVKDIVRQKDGSYLVAGHTLIEEMQQKFRLPLKGQGYTTIGGLVFGLIGHEPRVHDVVQIGKLHIEIKEIEGKRIKSLLIRKAKPKE